MRGGLRGINQHAGAGTARPRADLRGRIDIARDIRDVAETDKASPLGELLIEIIEPHATLIIHFHIADDGARLLGHQPPRQEIRSVLGHGQEQLIARPKPRTSPGAGDEIDALGCSSHPHDFIGIRSIDEGGQRAARALVVLIGSPRQGVERAPRVGVVVPVVLEQRCEHRRGSLRRGGTVEVRERLAVHGLVERREIGAPAGDLVEFRRARGRRPRFLPGTRAEPGRHRRLAERATGDFAPGAKA